MTVYSDNPIEIARDFEKCGCTHIHMVDLEGAKDGTTPNLAIVEQVARETSLFVEIGGGIRNMETVERYLNAGVSRVILGTAAVNDEAFLREAVNKYGEKIAVGADVKDSRKYVLIFSNPVSGLNHCRSMYVSLKTQVFMNLKKLYPN